jgi:protocatechuate 3,4-dioxygenase beta subunit
MLVVALLASLSLQSPSPLPRDMGTQRGTDDGKCVLRGRVLDGLSGRPIRGAIVTAYSEGRDGSPPSTSSNDEGRWELRGLVVGEYHLNVDKPGFTDGGGFSRTVALTEARPERVIDLTMNRGAVLSGRIVDAAGEPMPGIEVMALHRNAFGNEAPQWVQHSSGVSTDDRGDFRLYGLGAGEYVVAAKPQNRLQQSDDRGPRVTTVLTYYPGTPNIDEAQRFSLEVAAEHSDLVFALQDVPAIAIRGRVLLPAGQVAESFAMLVPTGTGAEQVMGNERLAEVKPDGSFAFSGVAAGNYRLAIRLVAGSGEERVGELDITAAQDDINDVVVPTYGPTMIRGRVIVQATAGSPGLIGVSASTPRGGIQMMGSEGTVASPKDWTFELKAYHSPVLLHASVRSGGWTQSAVRWKGQDVGNGLAFEPGQAVEGVEILVRRMASRITGSVSGVVREGEDDNEGFVVFFYQSGDTPPRTGMVGSVPIRDGRFAIGPMAAGDYRVVAVRRFDPSIVTRPEEREQLRARATDVSVGDNETKTIRLTLLTDY